MLERLPFYIPLTFAVTTLVSMYLFFLIVKNVKSGRVKYCLGKIIIGMHVWLLFQAFLTLKNTYSSSIDSIPPKIVLFGILPPIVAIILLFSMKNGRRFIDELPLINITYLNLIRIPVEIVLYCLFVNKVVPEIMTFEGINFDIFAGLTSPIIAYYGLIKQKFNRMIILIWNFICLGLLINIVIIAFLSAPSPLQKLAFEQPNIAILRFPYSWLPTFIVPLVLFGHLVSIRQLLKN
ncbi:hypothetical protein [Chryseobacterium culicis]|uniref:hypothetical protein n=1 Tax=Chryseobacterium culicis TaxID=680127 RepID=UPI001874B55D|nr:hypothetical protein [Chryseobacterium culicis]MBE4948254.1 hypothetical protein [Chryseobacterium culicis]